MFANNLVPRTPYPFQAVVAAFENSHDEVAKLIMDWLDCDLMGMVEFAYDVDTDVEMVSWCYEVCDVLVRRHQLLLAPPLPPEMWSLVIGYAGVHDLTQEQEAIRETIQKRRDDQRRGDEIEWGAETGEEEGEGAVEEAEEEEAEEEDRDAKEMNKRQRM